MTAESLWIVCPYGHLPADGRRDYRCYLLGRALAERGQPVVWWTSSFDHFTRRQRDAAAARSDVPGFEIRLVRAPGYERNVSVRRIWSEWSFGREFARQASRMLPPATIVLADPARFYGGAVTAYARRTGARVVLDVMDLWPELFETLAPRWLRGVARWALAPLYRQRRQLAEAAAALVAVTTDYLETVLPGPAASAKPRHVAYLGPHRGGSGTPIPESVRRAVAREANGTLLVAYTGSLGAHYDLEALVGAARSLRDHPVRWIIAGAGPGEPVVEKAARELGPGRFIFLGLQPADAVAWLLRQCDVGLCCYREGSTVSMPLKAFDYLAAGVAIVSSVSRELEHLIAQRGAGLNYAAGDAGALAAAVRRFAEDRALLSRCRGQAAQLALRYDAQLQHGRYAEFLIAQRLATQRPATRAA